MNTLLLVVLIINCLILGALAVLVMMLGYSVFVDMQNMNKRPYSKISYCNNCDKELFDDCCYEDREYTEEKECEEPTSVKCTRVFI